MQTGSVKQDHDLTKQHKEMDGDDVSFMRTEDVVCLVCTNGESMKRGYLAAEGFGSQLCHLEPEPKNQEPCELWKCTFQLEDALSVHAMYTQGLKAGEKRQSSRKILMYGHAVLLRHVETKKLLRCLSTSPSTDKLAYNIGFTEQPDKRAMDESCWFTVHPASNQRSEGEKVRAGDDIFLVSVANERYLSAQLAFFQNAESDSISTSRQPLNMVQASFHQCVWALHIVCSGSAKEAAIGNVNGGDIVRFIHRHGSEDCLTVAARESDKRVTADKTPAEVCYEPAQSSLLRSLWRVELFKMRFGGGFTSWGQPFRLRHIVTGKFLGVKVVGGCREGATEGKEKHSIALLDPSEASKEASAFCFTNFTIKEDHQWNELRVDNMGLPEVHFGDSEVLLLHCTSERVVGCTVSERGRQTRSLRGVRRAVAQAEMHQSFAFTVTRASEEEAKAASIVQLSEDTMRHYVHKMLLQCETVSGSHLTDKLYNVLSDLCYYFAQPSQDGLKHDQHQQQMCQLTERQHLFQKQGMLLFTLSVILESGKKCRACEPATEKIHHKLYQLLAAMIRGNHSNCREFATHKWLEIFIDQLEMPTFTHDVLAVIQCLLTDSPEVLNIISEKHIDVIVNILRTNGRDEKVMKLLSSLCVCHGVAMRDKQRLISKHLLSCRDLLLQTSLHNQVHCVHPSVYLSVYEGSAMYKKWYFEVELTQLSCKSSYTPHFRAGWAHASLFQPHPTSNSINTTCGGIGDDVYSLAFDGESFWVGGHDIEPSCSKRLQRQASVSQSPTPSVRATPISVGDVIGCCLDLEREVAWFTRNGSQVPGHLVFHHCREMVTPAISFSAGVSAVVSLGGRLGRFHHGPPPGYAGIHEAVGGSKEVKLQPFLCLGTSEDLWVSGPAVEEDHETFVPAPIDTSKVILPDPVVSIRDKLAKNIHEVWAKNKIDIGYSYAEARNDDRKHNPCLKAFEDLSEGERRYDYDMALETLSTLVALGYQISSNDEGQSPVAYMDLPPEKYELSNGYLPCPLNLESVTLDPALLQLVEKLAENAHNIWAASRIREGWSYGKATDSEMKRNPLLVPYSKLDAAAKKSNWDTAYESVRTISALGCTIEPPSVQPTSIHQLGRRFTVSNVQTRTFRGQTCYRLMKGKWFYEVKLLTGGMMRMGWATPSYHTGQQLGADENSYAFDGFLARKWHHGSESFGRRWNTGDIVGCLLDIDEKTISFTLNGDLLQGSFESTVAFEHINTSEGLVPAITLSAGERAQLNFGQSKEALHHNYTASGYEPVCSPAALHYNIPLWYSSAHGAFEVIGPNHPRLVASRRTRSGIVVRCKDWDYSHRPTQECLRLNLGVTLPLEPQDLSPSIPTLHPRPGPLSPSPTSEVDIFKMFSKDLFSPKKLMVSYSAVVPAGQVPSLVFIGWTTSGFRYIESQFRSGAHLGSRGSPSLLRYGQQVDVVTKRRHSSTSSFSTAFLVCLSEFLTDAQHHIPAAIIVHCVLDTMSGKMTFSCTSEASGHSPPAKEISLVASGGCKLFPTVIITPSTEQFVQFNFSPALGCQPISSVLISTQAGDKLSPCPPRMKIMAVTTQWVRQPTHKPGFSTSSAAGGALQLTAEKDPVYSIFATLPEEDTVLSIHELSEHHRLMAFHIQTLGAYSAVCSHSNRPLAEAIDSLLDPAQLLQCLKVEGMRFELRAAYLQLLSSLHLEHEVLTRLMMRGEFILPRSECTRSVSLFSLHTKKPQKAIYRIAMAPLPGLDPALSNQTNISHNISSTFSRMPYKEEHFPINELKELIFSELEQLLATQYYSGRLLPCRGSSDIFVPLLKVLDQLLVVGVIQEEKDLRRLLELLDPEQFVPKKTHKHFHRGLLSENVAAEEPVKLQLCHLLQHLCDCQVQHRVEAIVTFAQGFVDSLQDEQKLRHETDFKTRPKEFRSPPGKQMEYMLSFKHTLATRDSNQHKKRPLCSDCHTSEKLQRMLQDFHGELKRHCGCVDSSTLVGRRLEDMGVREKLERMVELVMAGEEEEERRRGEGVTTLQQLITRTMLQWACSEVKDLKLVGQIFALLYRQYDEIHEVVQALRKTYVIEVAEDAKGKPNYDIPSFRTALAHLRLLLKVGMGKTEEEALRNSLRSIRNSDLFYCHPHLLRSLGVHSTVLGLMESYLGISSGSSHNQVLSARRKQRLSMLKEGLPLPVEACCKFLCKFARISHSNQLALFDHIGYLLEHLEKYPGLMTCQGYTPLDVATATIKDNQELVLALEPSHLESVVSLLVATTTATHSESHERGGDVLLQVRTSSVSCEWAPNGGEKCLEFLQSAVWVENEQIQENAYVVVRLLIRHSECLGPALAGEALGLRWAYEEAIDHLEDTPQFFTPRDSSADLSMQSQDSTAGPLHHSHSYFNINLLSTRLLLSFYTSLVRLLACCGPGHTPSQGNPAPQTLGTSSKKSSTAERTRNILQNLVKVEEIVGVLSLPFSRDMKNGLCPQHKEAALLFLDRVYGVTGWELMLKLLTDAFLPDIKSCLKPVKSETDSQQHSSLSRYLCCSVLPFLSRYATVFRQLLSHLHVIDNLLMCCFRLTYTTQLSVPQLEETAAFLTAIIRELHPRIIQRLMPKIIADIPNLNTYSHSIVTLKLLSSHYEYFARYYGTGMLDRTSLGLASEEEKTCAALVVYRLLDTLSEKLCPSSSLLRCSASCLKAVCSALAPDSLIPSRLLLASMYNSSSASYEPRPVNISHIVLPPELWEFVGNFASYQHDSWSYEQHSEGWTYGSEKSDRKHPYLRPFQTLPEQYCRSLMQPAEDAVKYLLARGWTLSKVKPTDTQSVPLKPKMTCLRRRRRRAGSFVGREAKEAANYEPSVIDLSKVETPVELLAIAEQMAENAHDKWAKELDLNNADFLSQQLYQPYELLDEVIKDKDRSYALDLLRYLRVSGFELSRTRVRMSTLVQSSGDSQCQEKFAVQLFEKALELLGAELQMGFYLEVLFPMLTSYLECHAGYFVPSVAWRGSSFASQEEKTKILHVFCRVMEFTRRNLDKLFASAKKLSAQTLLSPVDGRGGKEGKGDSSVAAAKGILALVESLIGALDVIGILQGKGTQDHSGIVDFFRQATSGIHLTTKSISRQTEADTHFHFYCLHLLIPSLTTLFQHLGAHNAGQYIIEGPVLKHCQYIFQDLVDMATCCGPVFVGSPPLIAIGKCMGAFSLAYPEPFLEHNVFGKGFNMQALLQQLATATAEGVTCGNVLFVVDVIIPVLANYITKWWSESNDGDPTLVSVAQVDEVLTQALSLMATYFGQHHVKWFIRVIESCTLLAGKCSLDLLESQFVPLLEELRERAISLWQDEQHLYATWSSVGEEKQIQKTEALNKDYLIFVRDLMMVLPFLTLFLHAKQETLRNSSEDTQDSVRSVFVSVADIFHCWFSSQHFRREFQSGMQSLMQHTKVLLKQPLLYCCNPNMCKGRGTGGKRAPNLLLICLQLLLPIGDQWLSQGVRALVDRCREKLGEKRVTPEDMKMELIRDLESQAASSDRLAHKLVLHLSRPFFNREKTVEERAVQVLSLARVKHRMHQVENPVMTQSRWRQLFTQRRRKAVIDCFLAVPYFKLSKHRAVNLFLQSYCSLWLMNTEHANHEMLTEELLDHQDYLHCLEREKRERGRREGKWTGGQRHDPLSQLITMFKRVASTQGCIDEPLYTSYADVLSTSVIGSVEEDELAADDNPTKAYELYCKRKAELILKQSQLAERGAPTMVLLVITAFKGEMCPVVHSTLRLGIALLKEGNQKIQHEMLEQLKSMDVGYLQSIAKLISSCSVLDWNAYERYNKSEPVQTTSSGACCKVLPQSAFTISLFRFLQLLCEGHNEVFQNYLRTQAGNTTTVNIIICTVDYLLRLQESISDFYWHYSDYETIDLQGRENFLKAFKVAKQVFRTLTEYTQGPCVKNQEALASSRLWDAVSGFLHIFTVLQRKLYRDTSQVELLRELLGLQEEMFILLLSMLEGSVMSSNIGKLMVDMLMESAQYIEDIIQFFSIFVKLKDVTTSKAFKEYDLNKDGLISYREFEMAMEAQQRYTKEEIAYLMECADTNKDGLLDYKEFTERFHQPAESIGFHLCVLIVHLSDHLPQDRRLERFKCSPQGRELMEHFQCNMGCIEILGKSKRIERVYFEVKESWLQQWEEAQIQESKWTFLQSVEMGSQKKKLEGFISFCEDTIFEMDYVDSISGTENVEQEKRAEHHRHKHTKALQLSTEPFLSRMRSRVQAFNVEHSPVQRVLAWLSVVLSLMVTRLLPACKTITQRIRERTVVVLTGLKQRLQPKGAQAAPGKRRKGNLRLDIPPPSILISQDGNRAATAQEGGSMFFRTRAVSDRRPDKDHTSPQPTNISETTRAKSAVDSPPRKGSLVHTPRAFNMRQLTLSYNRARMKPPSHLSGVPTDQVPQPATGSGGVDSYIPKITSSTRGWQCFLARNYYRLNSLNYVITIIINVLLLTFQVERFSEGMHPHIGNASAENASEKLGLHDPFWAPLLMRGLSTSHFVISAILIAAYWHLKVPLIIFKREKQVARNLEMRQMWIRQPPKTLADWWDQRVISARSFPQKYWDKQIKQRVCSRFGGEVPGNLEYLLGIDVRSKYEKKTKFDLLLETIHSLVDLRYWVWVLGVVLSNMAVIYHILYCGFSFMGLHWNYFYYSMHLFDLVVNVKLAKHAFGSLLHNVKQLAMTVLMTCVVIYMYTVIAFNFFRKFYHQSNMSGQEVYNCDNMARCFIYHIDQGLRSGGGIADVLEPASGDPLRLFFDITFFFIVIVILLAIMQGLIIDGFGELRDKEEILTAMMQTKCFVCGLDKSNFDHIPHGFDSHVSREHSMSHYMLMLLYLIKKRESEFSGQESYVWEMYLQQNWDFFPVGDCFHAQEDRREQQKKAKQVPSPSRVAKTVT